LCEGQLPSGSRRENNLYRRREQRKRQWNHEPDWSRRVGFWDVWVSQSSLGFPLRKERWESFEHSKPKPDTVGAGGEQTESNTNSVPSEDRSESTLAPEIHYEGNIGASILEEFGSEGKEDDLSEQAEDDTQNQTGPAFHSLSCSRDHIVEARLDIQRVESGPLPIENTGIAPTEYLQEHAG